MSGSFRCSSGGLVSLSGVWFENGRGQSCERIGAGRKTTRGGRGYLEILGADIVTNNGSACLLRRDVATATDVLAHELGHSLGLAHSVSDEEIMWGEVRRPRAALGDGDLENLTALYGASKSDRPPGR